jgi:hypothetical protein
MSDWLAAALDSTAHDPLNLDGSSGCYYCDVGFPLKEGRIHYGTQRHGMIPDAPCKLKEKPQ